ncbi:MAG: hypothetical protein JWM06_2891 [Actinomycetia bacterium]|nr:hypothetical protein [Actinomycetes bacterium]
MAAGHVVEVFEPSEGGVPAYVATLTEGLLQRGWKVTVVAPSRSAAVSELRLAGADVVPLPLRHGLGPSDAHAVALIARLCRRGSSVIHGHSTKAGLLAGAAGQLAGVPSIYSPHCWAFTRQGPRGSRALFVGFERSMARAHRRIVAVAESEAREAIRYAIAERAAVRVVHTGLRDIGTLPRRRGARALLRIREDALVACWVGRRAPQKRPQDLAPLAARLRRDGIDLMALGTGLAGSPEGRAFADIGGRLLEEGTDPACVYAAADVCVQTSAWEALPLTVLEAMRAALPVVAYRVGGLPEQVRDGDNGYLVAVGDIRTCAARIAALGSAPDERRRLAAAARARFQSEFTLDRMLDRIEEVYDEVRLRERSFQPHGAKQSAQRLEIAGDRRW